MARLKYFSQYDLDDPRRTMQHAEIIKSKPFLKKLYIDWYKIFANEVQDLPNGKMIEIGSGGGFLKEIIPSVITSDILPLENCDMIFSAENLPFENESLSAIFMVNVLHHISRPKLFFDQAQQKLMKGGKIVMIETANSALSSFIYRTFHHEPFDVNAGWELNGYGPLSISNQAIPWIIFERDREVFLKLFPKLKIESIKYHTPLRYILSGGVSRRGLVPDWTFGIFSLAEKILSPVSGFCGLFVTIKVKKINNLIQS